jgi:hypothetical protein
MKLVTFSLLVAIIICTGWLFGRVDNILGITSAVTCMILGIVQIVKRMKERR